MALSNTPFHVGLPKCRPPTDTGMLYLLADISEPLSRPRCLHSTSMCSLPLLPAYNYPGQVSRRLPRCWSSGNPVPTSADDPITSVADSPTALATTAPPIRPMHDSIRQLFASHTLLPHPLLQPVVDILK